MRRARDARRARRACAAARGAAPTNQLTSYYRFGIPDWCPDYLNKWTTCLRLKTKMPEEAAAARRRALERERIGHIWDFKPAHAAEAAETYGESVRVRASADAPQVPSGAA